VIPPDNQVGSGLENSRVSCFQAAPSLSPASGGFLHASHKATSQVVFPTGLLFCGLPLAVSASKRISSSLVSDDAS
jgi:hypothetical protein